MRAVQATRAGDSQVSEDEDVQKFASAHNHFNQERHLSDRAKRSAALAEWRSLMTWGERPLPSLRKLEIGRRWTDSTPQTIASKRRTMTRAANMPATTKPPVFLHHVSNQVVQVMSALRQQ